MAYLSNKIESDLIDALLESLNQTPMTHAHLAAREAPIGGSRADAVIDARTAGQPYRLIVECKAEVFPRDIRELTWKLRAMSGQSAGDGAPQFPFISAETISPGAKEILRQEQVGYSDKGGSLFVPAPGAYLFIDKPLKKSAERKLGAIFQGRRAQVLHAVWEKRGEWFGVHQLAKLIDGAPATVSETLTTAERHNWLEVRGSGPSKERRLVDPQAFLDAWSEHQRQVPKPKLKRYFVPGGGSLDVTWKIDAAFADRHALYEITGEAAAQQYAPYLSSVSQVRCRFMDNTASRDALEAIDARPVREGWNLGVLEADAEGEFAFRRHQSVWLASPLKVYLDLLQGTGRSPEMAQHLRETMLQ
ncbi:hypothetical protein GVN18_34885 [Pseudomonas sp. ODNR1LW]|nr:hypothetical protein [Pseudomonas sp. ODNR1LW]